MQWSLLSHSSGLLLEHMVHNSEREVQAAQDVLEGAEARFSAMPH